jgi:uncharacterized protein YkwD
MNQASARLAAAALLAAASLLAISCGGSGGGSPTDPGGSPSLTAIEYQSFDLINQDRRDNGVSPQLTFDSQLADVARAYSERMRDEGFFSHIDPQGHDVAYRLQTGGVTYTVAAENLAEVTHTNDPAAYSNQQFLTSQPHRGNILNPRMRRAGVGVAFDGTTYWITQLFIAP